jgi:AraC-like DNA-binding protein
MLTEQHCEHLAIWAFRVGVRDYLHSPMTNQDLIDRVEFLSTIPTQPRGPQHRVNPLLLQPPPTGLCCVVGSAKRPAGVTQALSYIESRLGQRITLRQVAEACGFTSFAFSRAFKKELGITFQEYLVRLRIDRAQRLLADPRMSVTAVAGAAGFGDLSHFSRTFRRYVGTSPSDYRRDEQSHVQRGG